MPDEDRPVLRVIGWGNFPMPGERARRAELEKKYLSSERLTRRKSQAEIGYEALDSGPAGRGVSPTPESPASEIADENVGRLSDGDPEFVELLVSLDSLRSEDDYRSLFSWLRREAIVTDLQMVRSSRSEEEMGGYSDGVRLRIPRTGFAEFSVSITAWLAAFRRRDDVTATIRTQTGQVVADSRAVADDVAAALRGSS